MNAFNGAHLYKKETIRGNLVEILKNNHLIERIHVKSIHLQVSLDRARLRNLHHTWKNFILNKRNILLKYTEFFLVASHRSVFEQTHQNSLFCVRVR